MQKYRATIFIQIILILVTVLQLSAQDINRKKFKVNEHEFLATSSVNSANIETRLFTKLSFGSTGLLTSKGITIGDEQYLSYTGSLLYAGGGVAYKQKVNDWFALYLNIRFLGRVGTQVPTILAEGINTATGSELGWVFKIYEYQKGYLSGTVYTNRYKGSLVNIVGFFEDVINGAPDPRIIDVVPVSSLGARVQYAHAFSKTWGTQFDFSYAYGEALNRSADKSNIDMGIFVDANLYAEKKIPLGFGLGYNLTSLPETIYTEDELANIFYFNLAYTKANDFELGLEVMYYKVPLSNYTTKPSVISPNLLMVFRF